MYMLSFPTTRLLLHLDKLSWHVGLPFPLGNLFMVEVEALAMVEGHIQGAIGTAEDGAETRTFNRACLGYDVDASTAVQCLHIQIRGSHTHV